MYARLFLTLIDTILLQNRCKILTNTFKYNHVDSNMMTDQFIYKEFVATKNPKTEYDRWDYTLYSINHNTHRTKKVRYINSVSDGDKVKTLESAGMFTDGDERLMIIDTYEYDAVCEALNSLN